MVRASPFFGLKFSPSTSKQIRNIRSKAVSPFFVQVFCQWDGRFITDSVPVLSNEGTNFYLLPGNLSFNLIGKKSNAKILLDHSYVKATNSFSYGNPSY